MTTDGNRSAGWAAIASGVLAVVGFGLLIAYLSATPQEILEAEVLPDSEAMPAVSRHLLMGKAVAVALQYFLLVPVARALHALSAPRSRAVFRLGLVATCAVATLQLLPLASSKVCDVFFMGPAGLVGAWLIIASWRLGWPTRIVGLLAGLGLVILGFSLFFLAPSIPTLLARPLAYSSDVDFHDGLALGGLLANFYPIWAILVGRRLLRAPRGRVRSRRLRPD